MKARFVSVDCCSLPTLTCLQGFVPCFCRDFQSAFMAATRLPADSHVAPPSLHCALLRCWLTHHEIPYLLEQAFAGTSMSKPAAFAAKKGVGLLKSGLSALSIGVSKARKGYANQHESSVIADLKHKGLSPTDFLFEALQKVYFLFMAGYKHEVIAVALQAGKRLTEMEKSSVPVDVVKAFGYQVCEECLKYGDFEKGKFQQTMQDFLSKARMGKEQFDRDSLVHDIYYGVLFVVETTGTEWLKLEQVFREAASHVISDSINVTAATAHARKRAAKALFMFATQVRTIAQESELKRQKALKEAENLLRKEQERQRNSLPRYSSDAQ